MVKHPVAQICLQSHAAAKEAYTPQKATKDHRQNDLDHGHTNAIDHQRHIESNLLPVFRDVAVCHAVDHHAVKLRDLQL